MKIKAVSPEFIPKYQTKGAAAADVIANIGRPGEERYFPPNSSGAIDIGFQVEIPEGWEMQIRARSGLARQGFVVTNAPGTVDSDFRGNIQVLVRNIGNETITIRHLSRIAQVLLKPVWFFDWIPVDQLSETERGSGGFGSTGLG